MILVGHLALAPERRLAPGSHSEATRTHSREIGLGRSMHQWLIRMGVPIGGKSMLSIKDQAERISRCTFTFDLKGNRFNGIGRMNIFDKTIFTDSGAGEGGLFPQVAKLSEQFFDHLIGDPTYAAAILDRLVNKAYRIELKGKSMRGNGAHRGAADPAVDEIDEQSK
jgi:hypothetical protein